MQRNELRSIMAKHGDTCQTLAEVLAISIPAFSNKLNGKRPFTLKEIAKMQVRYNLSWDDIVGIFL